HVVVRAAGRRRNVDRLRVVLRGLALVGRRPDVALDRPGHVVQRRVVRLSVGARVGGRPGQRRLRVLQRLDLVGGGGRRRVDLRVRLCEQNLLGGGGGRQPQRGGEARVDDRQRLSRRLLRARELVPRIALLGQGFDQLVGVGVVALVDVDR